ncbi:MAG TPA: N-formylglutamate amidohydrolase [Ensifer sp.]|nr:N-formylglutamate amidohydrolase [Ensifer sp.]
MGKRESVLSADEIDPVGVELAGGQGPFVIVCEHASSTLPRAMGDMGLSEETRLSHIAWDPGALAVARMLSARFDSPLVFQKFSRLVYDCNRPPESPAAMPAKSEIFAVPANETIDGAERLARTRALYRPFHAAISKLIDERTCAGLATSLITVHSFTPVYFGKPRAVEVGILHDADSRFADGILSAAASDRRYDLRRNEPYGPADGVTHSLILHGISRGIPNVMIEVRNDLIADQTGQGVMAGYLSELIAEAIGAQDKKNKTFVNVRSH